MWYKTRVGQTLGIQYPILQGPFGGGLSSAKLVCAVSNAGGLGGYGAYQLQPEEIIKLVGTIRSATKKPFNINLWVNDVDEESKNYSDDDFEKMAAVFKPFFYELNVPLPGKPKNAFSKFEKQAETLLRLNVPVFSFIFGIPDKSILNECKRNGTTTIGAATTLEEASLLEEAEVDLIVASGFEAGGHRPSFLKPAEDSLTGTFVLVQQLVSNLKTPVIAAGGIYNAKGVQGAMALGASGVQIGTAFLACEESGATNEYRKIIFSERSKHVTLTKSFTGRLARGTVSSISEATHQNAKHAPFPLQALFLKSLRKAAIEQGKTEMLTFWMGQGASLVKFTSADLLFKSLLEGLK